MKNSELIKKLQEFDGGLEVKIYEVIFSEEGDDLGSLRDINEVDEDYDYGKRPTQKIIVIS